MALHTKYTGGTTQLLLLDKSCVKHLQLRTLDPKTIPKYLSIIVICEPVYCERAEFCVYKIGQLGGHDQII